MRWPPWRIAAARQSATHPLRSRRFAAERRLAWDREVERFFRTLAAFDAMLAGEEPLGVPPEKLLQGPIADALTHIGQIAMLRRLAGAPVRGESYFQADIAAGRVGSQQAPPRREF